MEKYRDGQRELHCVFVDLEKAYDRVPREELWYCMRKSGVAEKYVRVVQDMYERSRTVVRCAVGQTEEFKVEVGLHQGSAFSPFLFAMVMDQLSEEVRQESPWTMMFADDIVICSESREQVEENLERWRFALERRGMKVSRSKTDYMCVNEREGSGTVRLQGEEVKKVQEFKYLGSTVQSNGECRKEESYFTTVRLIYSIGYAASLISLSVAVVVLLTFRRLHCARNYIHIQLFISFMLKAVSVFIKDATLFGSEDTDHCSLSTAGCKASVVFCHYCVMSNFSWLLVEAVYLNSLLLSARSRRCLWGFSLLGWGPTL
ncbi:hypothetical protein QTP70_000595 [Hemibagrus guttatus]|uniref:ribonuclease H n=1 Tax=Hemibagrus guttatus TaxID=175788 RepID=A0AAE0QCP5_9TELE|nr:hypothetical protein QTP70_000595 [Hemibagrus guttatus]